MISSHLTTATVTATASIIKPTTATAAHKLSINAAANTNGVFRPGTTASTTANDGEGYLLVQMLILVGQPQQQVQL